jgi:F420-non-reducing hydrogenase iron-sulfur subunit
LDCERECNYQVGNYDAIVIAHVTRKIMEVARVKPEGRALDWASAAEAPLFVELVTRFTKRVKELGPLGAAEGIAREELNLKLSAARSALESVKLRTRFGKLALDLRRENGYASDLIEAKVAEKVSDAIMREIAKQEKTIAKSGVQSAERMEEAG